MQLTLSIDKYEKTLADGAAAAFPTSLKAAALAPLKNFQQPFVDCLDDAAVLREIWNKPKTRLALSGRVDVFPWIRGFHPDPTEPETPQRNDSEVRLELSYEFSGVEMKAGIGGGSRRSGVNQRLVGYISPSASVALAVARLGREPLYEDGQLNLLDGALPPRLVVGLDASLQYAPEPPPTQVANVQKVSVTAFFDFRFTEKLSVRLGIPLEAKLAERKAGTPNGPAKIDRQWTVPAFVATVLAL